MENEQYFVQGQPIIKYGPLLYYQLKELYINEVINDHTFITTSSALRQFEKAKRSTPNLNALPVISDDPLLWKPIRSAMHIHAKLEDALSTFHKSDPARSAPNIGDETKSTDHSSNNGVNFQVNMNVNGPNAPTNLNINITSNNNNNNNHSADNSSLSHHMHSPRYMKALLHRCQTLQANNEHLMAVNKDVQAQRNMLTAKYESQFTEMQSKVARQLEEYKLQCNALRAEIRRLSSTPASSATATTINSEQQQLISDNQRLHEQHTKLLQEKITLDLNLSYYQMRCKVLQTQVDSDAFDHDRYQLQLGELKEQLLHKDTMLASHSFLVDSLLKQTVAEFIPYSSAMNEAEGGNHNEYTYHQHTLQRNVIRLDALKTSELSTWFSYAQKFFATMEMLSEHESISRRQRLRVKNVVNMLGEKIKALNVDNLSQTELVTLSRDLKQAYDVISSEQHMKEYELSMQRKELLRNMPMTTMSPLLPSLPQQQSALALSQGVSAASLVEEHDDDDHEPLSFASMSLIEMQPGANGTGNRNPSLHSMSPSLSRVDSVIAKHRKKSETIKGSGLPQVQVQSRLLTDQDSLNWYLNQQKGKKESHHHKDVVVNKEAVASSPRLCDHSSSPRVHNGSHHVLNPKSPVHAKSSSALNTVDKYSHYSAFNTTRSNKRPRSIRQNKKQNDSMTSLSALSSVGGDCIEYDDDDDASSVGSALSPREERPEKRVAFDTPNPTLQVTLEENKESNDNDETALSADILSFFAM